MGLCRRCDRDQCRDDTPDALVRIVRINRCGSRSRHSLAAKCAALGRALPVVAAATGGEHPGHPPFRSEEHTSELQSLMRISYAVFCLKKKTKYYSTNTD